MGIPARYSAEKRGRMANEIGRRIKALRQDRAMTQAQLGAILGVGKAAVNKYETGVVTDLKSSTIKKLCETFKVFPRYFVYDTDEEFWSLAYGDRTLTMHHLIREHGEAVMELEELMGLELLRLMADIFFLENGGAKKVRDYVDVLKKANEAGK